MTSVPRLYAWFLLWVLGWQVSVAWGQAVEKPNRPSSWPQRTVRFLSEKPVTGLPPDGSRGAAHCSPEGEVFFNVSGEQAGMAGAGSALPALYRLKDSGEVQLLPRTAPPPEYTDVSVRDFFAAAHTLVTLIRAEVRNGGDPSAPPSETRYFLSLSDHDGDSAKLVPLDVSFRPSKVAVFASGDFLVLGWDQINLMPVLAMVKDDGTVRRFIDLANTAGKSMLVAQPDAADTSSVREVESKPAVRAAQELLEKAVFVPYGSEVLLTFPGTTKAVQVWSPVGDSRNIPIALPAGFLLHDVLVSGTHWTMVLRAQAAEDFATEKTAAAEKPRQRLFEMDSTHGSLLREFLMDKPTVPDVTCAVSPKLTAVFLDSIAGEASAPSDAPPGDSSAPRPTHLVIATAMR